MKVFSFRTILFSVYFILLAPLSALAVGGGGGGSVPSCSQDTWTCSDWSSCSTSGAQARTCTLTYDCPTATTPKPAETQSCTPPTPPTPPPAPTPVIAPTTAPSSSTPPPVITKTPAAVPSCTKDTWSCGDWSASCDIEGLEHRACKLTYDCPRVATPPPITGRSCSHLQCGDKATLADRVSCRLHLDNNGIARELEIQYLPEECRAMNDKTEKAECVARYRSYAPCWSLPPGESRFACARDVLKLGSVVSDEVKTCQGKTGADQASCKDALRDKVFYLIKFRFYDLEQRAEDLARRGADLNATAALETTIEEKKQLFDSATTDDVRRQIILDMRAAWESFIAAVKDQVK